MSEPKKILYVEIPNPLHRAIKVIAASEDRLLSEIVCEALSLYALGRQSVLPNVPEQPVPPKSPKNAKSPKSPQARTGPGSLGYVPPMPAVEGEGEESLSEPLPVATDDENPFADDGGDHDLLPDKG